MQRLNGELPKSGLIRLLTQATWDRAAIYAALLGVLAYLMLVAEATVSSALLTIIFLILVGYLPAFTLLHRSEASPTLTETLIYTTTGLISVSVTGLVLWALQLPQEAAVIAAGFIGVTGAVRRRSSVIPVKGSWNFSSRFDRVFSLFIVTLFVFQPLYSYLYMGRGEFAPAFINVDAPLQLSHTWAIIQTESWPPVSLEMAGVYMSAHRGVQNAAALISTWSGLPPHVALFTVCCGLFLTSAAAAALAFAQAIRNRLPAWLPLGLLCAFALNPVQLVVDTLAGHSLQVSPIWHPGGIYAMAVVFICLFALADRLRPRTSLALASIWTLVGSRATDFIALSLGIGGASLTWLAQKFSLRLIAKLALFGCASLAVIFLLMFGGSNISAKLKFGSMFFSWLQSQDFDNYSNIIGFLVLLGNFIIENDEVILFLSVLIIFGVHCSVRVDLLCMAMAPVLFLNVISFENKLLLGDSGEYIRDYNSAFRNMLNANAFFWWGLLAAYACAAPHMLKNNISKTAYYTVVGIVSLAVLFLALQSSRLIWDVRRAYEYADNRSVAEALRTIPVKGSLLVTNDTNYPMMNSVKDDRQYQLSALFGHHNFATNLKRIPIPDREERIEINEMLAARTWDPRLEDLAAERGWTHYVVHKQAPHPGDIPLPLLWENSKYAVYDFSRRQP